VVSFNLTFNNLYKEKSNSFLSCFDTFLPYLEIRSNLDTNPVTLVSEIIDEEYLTEIELQLKEVCDNDYDKEFSLNVVNIDSTTHKTEQ